MSQVFSRKTTLLLRLALALTVVLITAGIIAGRAGLGYASVLGPPIGEPPPQPVPFSHEHHVGEIGLDCRYCHSSVEGAATAGYPSSQVCMTCHSVLFRDEAMLAPVRRSWEEHRPLHWQRVHDLPDFVYFDHSVHVAKGVGCSSCHGAVDRMPLTWRTASLEMQWCIGCHQAPQRELRPRDHVFDVDFDPGTDRLALGRRLVSEYGIDTKRLTECSICHR